MATSPEELLRKIEGLKDDVAALRHEVVARWPSVLAGAVAVGLAIGATLWVTGDEGNGSGAEAGSGTGSGEIAKSLNDIRSDLARIDTLTKDLPPRLSRIESDLGALKAGVAPSSSALRSILNATDLSEADKDRVAQLATDSIRETINRAPDGAQARALRDLMAADAGEASFERKAKAARSALKPIFKDAAGKAGLGTAAIDGVVDAVGSVGTDTLRYVAKELPSALIGGLVGVLLDKLFDDTGNKLKTLINELETIKGACGKCSAACEGQPKPPAPPGTAANGSGCPAALVDPDSARFYFDSGEHELFCRSDATTRCAQRRRENQAKIEAIVKLARDRASATLLVWAHTDTVGRHEYNDDLARKRSHAVRDALIKVGISADRILEFPMGERVLVTPDPPADEKSNSDNRVVIVALGYRGIR
jgi:outer membrane protein OmpA-like peptidoglycan-associated protein